VRVCVCDEVSGEQEHSHPYGVRNTSQAVKTIHRERERERERKRKREREREKEKEREVNKHIHTHSHTFTHTHTTYQSARLQPTWRY
jgi:hypothetical protein